MNNGNYGNNIFYGCKFPTDITDVEFRICKGRTAFGNVTNPNNTISGSIIINCERLAEDDNMQWIFGGSRIKTVTFKNTSHLKRIYDINGSSGAYYGVDTFKGLDLSSCIDLDFSVVYYSFNFYADNFGKHPDFTDFLINWGCSSGGVHWYKTHKWPLYSTTPRWFMTIKNNKI